MIHLIGNYAMQTTAAPTAVATGTSRKTLLQVKLTRLRGKVIQWGISFNGSAAATPGKVELVAVDVAATVTAHAASGIQKYDAEALRLGDPTTDLYTVSTTTTGFNATVEGTITASRDLGGTQFISNTVNNMYQLPLGREPFFESAEYLRVIATFGTTVDAFCYVIVEV